MLPLSTNMSLYRINDKSFLFALAASGTFPHWYKLPKHQAEGRRGFGCIDSGSFHEKRAKVAISSLMFILNEFDELKSILRPSQSLCPDSGHLSA
jgi:hypothetical protein